MGMKPRSAPEKEPIYLKSRNRYLNSEVCAFSAMNLMCLLQAWTIMRRRPLEIGAFNPAPDLSPHE